MRGERRLQLHTSSATQRPDRRVLWRRVSAGPLIRLAAFVLHHGLHRALGFARDLVLFTHAVGAVFTQLDGLASDLHSHKLVDFVFAFGALHNCHGQASGRNEPWSPTKLTFEALRGAATAACRFPLMRRFASINRRGGRRPDIKRTEATGPRSVRRSGRGQ